MKTSVLVVGAGPCGTTIANLLGVYGIDAVVIDKDVDIPPFPRAVGVDDESLRVFQAAGLAEHLHADMIQNQQLRYFDSKGRSIIGVAPDDRPFGWPRRNSFLQPLLDRALRDGLERFKSIRLLTEAELVSLSESADGITATVRSGGKESTIQATYLVGADGGSSFVRKALGIELAGSTHGSRWLVVDTLNSPIHAPYAGNYIDASRPFISIDLPYGYRRFEFQLHADEADEAALDPEFVKQLIRERFEWPGEIEICVRPRVYLHHSRVAARFRSGRSFLAGDAAHLQPPWFGQGMNSGIRDAANLAWKLAAVLRGDASDAILDSYESERKGHAQDMVKLASFLGRIYAPKSRFGESVRSFGLRKLRHFPRAYEYVTKMKFKPMPRYVEGVVVPDGQESGPVGRMLIQPFVEDSERTRLKLDDAIGPWFSIIGLNTDPYLHLDEESITYWEGIGARFFRLNRSRPGPGFVEEGSRAELLDDVEGKFRDWQWAHNRDILFVRPDRYVAAACRREEAVAISQSLRQTIGG